MLAYKAGKHLNTLCMLFMTNGTCLNLFFHYSPPPLNKYRQDATSLCSSFTPFYVDSLYSVNNKKGLAILASPFLFTIYLFYEKV